MQRVIQLCYLKLASSLVPLSCLSISALIDIFLMSPRGGTIWPGSCNIFSAPEQIQGLVY